MSVVWACVVKHQAIEFAGRSCRPQDFLEEKMEVEVEVETEAYRPRCLVFVVRVPKGYQNQILPKK